MGIGNKQWLPALMLAASCGGCGNQHDTPPAASAEVQAQQAPAATQHTADDKGPRLPDAVDLPGAPRDLSDIAEASDRLRLWLHEKRFAELDEELRRLHRQSREHGSDRYFDEVFTDFCADADSQLSPLLDGWLQASHEAYAPAARGRHRLARGWAFRGTSFASETSDRRMDTATLLLEGARGDLELALQRDANLALAQADLVEIDMMIGPADGSHRTMDDAVRLRQTLDGSIALLDRHPESYAVRRAALERLQPKWGGDLSALFEFAERSVVGAAHPDFELLPSYAMCMVADELRIRDRTQEALALIRRIEAQYPAIAPICLSVRALTEIRGQRYFEAVRSFARFRTQAGQPEALAGELSNALLHSGQETQAREILDSALRRRPRDANLLCRRARLDMVDKQFQAALTRVDLALAQQPVNERCMALRSQALAHLDRTEEALASSEEALELQPDNALALTERGAALVKLKRYEEAAGQLGKALAVDPEYAPAWYWHGISARHLGQTDTAMDSLNRAVQLDPGQAVYWYERGIVRSYLMKNPDAAESDFQQAVTHDDRNASAWFELAGSRYRRRDCGFVNAFQRYVELCNTQECPTDRVEYARRWLGDPGLGEICPAQPS